MKKKYFFLLLTLFVTACAQPPKIKNVILMIGDGMGPQQVGMATLYRKLITPNQKELALEQLTKIGTTGTANTWSFDNIVTDSAAAATAMACGVKTLNDVIGLLPDGSPCQSILILAHQQGKATGLVTTTRFSHATPAAFVAHHVSREEENDIALEIIQSKNVDIILGGGARHLLPSSARFSKLENCEGTAPENDGFGKRIDDQNLVTLAQKLGYTFACTKDQLLKNSSPKLLGVFANSHLPYVTDRKNSSTIPTLPEMTTQALKILDQNEKGFFLMVEGGEIDFAGHENDAATLLKETLEFDAAIAKAIEYVQSHPDTLLVVTADHETGSFGFAYRQFLKNDPLLLKQLKNNQTYQPRYYAAPPRLAFDLLMKQHISYTKLLEPFMSEIYSPAPNVTSMTTRLKKELEKYTPYQLSDEEIAYVLAPESAFAVDKKSKFIFSSEGEVSEIHANKLGKVIGIQNFTVWGTGTHTAVPVPVFAFGPKDIASKFSGNIENSDIAKIIQESW